MTQEEIKAYQKSYRENNKEKIKAYREANREKQKEYLKNYDKINKEKKKAYRKKNRIKIIKKINEITKKRKKTDSLFKLKSNTRSLICNYLYNSGYKKKNKTEEILGCSFEEFKTYIESKFEPWMNWENRGKYNGELNYGWDLDHIIPLSSAKTEEDIILLNHYTNFQPLCGYTNRHIKREKIK